jgi:hypothetical protein
MMPSAWPWALGAALAAATAAATALGLSGSRHAAVRVLPLPNGRRRKVGSAAATAPSAAMLPEHQAAVNHGAS